MEPTLGIHTPHEVISAALCWEEEAWHKGKHAAGFYLHELQQQPILIFGAKTVAASG